MKTEKLASQRSLKNKISKVFNIVAQTSLVFYYTLGPAMLLAPQKAAAATVGNDVSKVTANTAVVPASLLADTGYQLPTDTHSPNEWGEGSLGDASNALTDNGQYAQDDDEGNEQGYQDFGFSIPAGSTIRGISVKAEAKSSDVSGCVLQMKLSWNNGSNYTSNWKTDALTGTDAILDFGGSADDWGRNWSPANFTDANFVVKMAYDDLGPGNTCQSSTVSVDYLQAKVDFMPPAVPLPNPVLPSSCGLDMGLVIDSSGSIDSTELGQMKTAFNAFVDAFLPGTPTQMSVVEFDTNVIPPTLGFTDNVTNIKNRINTSSSGGYTNWEDALVESHSLFPNRAAKPDLLVFASDGNPNTIGTTPPSDGGGATETVAVNAAVAAANAAKTDGIRVLALGIGNDLDINNLKAISGTNVNTGITSDVITSDFETLAEDLAEYAHTLCGGKILVQKQFDTNGDGVPELDGSVPDPLLSGWTFDVNGSPSNPDAQTTTNTGSLEFSVQNGTYSVIETNLKPDTALSSAQCVKGTTPVGIYDPITRTISGLTMNTDETISCRFVNSTTVGALRVTKVVNGGPAEPDDFGFRIVGWQGEYEYPASGQNFVEFDNLVTGPYSVEETTEPNYVLSSDCENVNVTAGQTTECTMTNTYHEPEPLTIVARKIVCDNESDLPDWGVNSPAGPDVTAATAQDWINIHPSCHFASDWRFQWSYDGVQNPGDNTGESSSPDWHTFGPTDDTGLASTTISDLQGTPKIWVREAWQSEYIPFASVINTNEPQYSAEFYCHTDVLNFDNWEWIGNPELEHTYYCIAFNVRQTGEVTFEKQVVGEGDRNDWTFTVNGHTYANGETVSLPTGVYTVIENGPDGYTNTGVAGICSQDATRASAVGARMNVTTEGGTCTFINEQDTGTIVVHKNVLDPENNETADNHTFAVQVDGADQKSVSESTNATYDNVPVGEYVITEVPDGDYDLVSITNNGYIKVKSGQTTDVYVVNKQKYAHLTVFKDVLTWDKQPVDDNTVFTAHVVDENQGFDKQIEISENAPVQLDQLIPGTYKISEIVDENYYLLNGYEPSDIVTLGSNGKAEVTVYNLQNHHEVTLEKTDEPDAVQAGGLLTYTLNWENTGTAPVNGLTITDTVPTDTTYSICTGGETCGVSGGIVTWDLGTQYPGAKGSVTLTVLVNTPLRDGTIIYNNEASIFSKETKPVYASAETTVKSDFNVILTKSAIDLTNPGTKIDYTLNWSVSGNSPIDSLEITDPIPTNTTFVAASDSGTEAGGTVTWDLGVHNPGDSGFVTVTVQAAWPLADGTEIMNTARFCGQAESSDTPEFAKLSDDQNVIEHCTTADKTTTITSSPILTVVKSDTPDPVLAGSELTYEIAWSVSGNSPATNVVITDVLPADTTFVSADSGSYDVATRTVTWALGNKVPPDSGTVMLKVTVAGTVLDGTNIANTVTIDSTENVPVTDSENTLVTNVPILTLTKTVDATKAVNPGDEVNYTVTVKNTGYATAKNLALNDVMPTELYYSDVLGSSRTFVSGGDLAIGDTLTFTYPVTVKTGTADGDYVNTATLTADNYKTLTAQATIAVTQGTVKGETAVPKLVIEKSVDVSFANPGDTVTYTVKISNTGEAPADQLVLGDILPAGFSFVETGGTTRSWDLGTLAQGKSVTVTYEVDIATSVAAGTYDNIATASADNADPVTAKKKLEVKSVEVKGAEAGPELPQTGAGLMDYIIFGSALITLAGSALGLRRSVRATKVKRS